jgi:FkbM family methyltransferase
MPASVHVADNAEVVANLYRGFFHREPDPGAETLVKALDGGQIDLARAIEILLASAEFRQVSQRLHSPPFMSDQSQYGEVQHLIRMMVNENRPCIVVDAGARGKERSNAYDLMASFGWKGILIEANPGLIAPISEAFDGLDLTLVSCAVSDFDGEATFHFGVNDDVSSLNKVATECWGETKGETTVSVRRLPSILAEHEVPKDFDLLSIDIEGEDVKVLNDVVAAGYRPQFVIIEACYNFKISSLAELPFSDEVRATYAIGERTPSNLLLKTV